MLNPDPRTLDALQRLRKDPLGKQVLEWLSLSLQAERVANDRRQDIELGWGQGAAQTLSDILERFESAEEELKRIQATQARSAARRRE